MGHSLKSSEYQVWRQLPRTQDLLLIAVSGGMDSAALVSLLVRIRRHKPLNFALAFVDHGPGSSPVQTGYRQRARLRTQLWARRADVDWFGEGSLADPPRGPRSQSEASLREYRYAVLRGLRRQLGASRILTAHHKDDLFETRVLNLLRGTGPQGLVSLREDDGELLRPLLSFSREDLSAELDKSFRPLRDPSNSDPSYRRNSLRRALQKMERSWPGSRSALARSLQLLADEHAQEGRLPQLLGPLWRSTWEALPVVQKRSFLVQALRSMGIKDYTHNHIDEIIKRLDTRRKRLRFQVCDVPFQLDGPLLTVGAPPTGDRVSRKDP